MTKFENHHHYEAAYYAQEPDVPVAHITGMSPFSVQILVGRELSKEEYAMFHVLTPDASDEDIRKFKDIALQNDDAASQKSVDNIIQVSILPTEQATADC